MDTQLSEGARTLLAIIRTAVKRGQFPAPFTTSVIQTILDALKITDEEYQQVTEILKADLREARATH